MTMRPGFKRLCDAVASAAPAAAHDAADLVADEVRARAPRLSGRLAGSTSVEDLDPTKASAGSLVVVTGGHEPEEMVGAVEFGRPAQGVAANPFIRRSFAARKGAAAELIRQRLRAALRK